jgi:transmembrane sensor
MIEQRRNPFENNQLHREATEWFVKMRGDEAEGHRPDFERWLARGALHRTAYNRIANLYSAGKRVDWDNLPPARPVRGAAKRLWMMGVGVAAIVGFVAWRTVAVPMLPNDSGFHSASIEATRNVGAVQYATRLGEIRSVKLRDGSTLIIDTDTLVTVDFSETVRRLRLEHGRARFEVAHEARPFIVDAGEVAVLARGTVFDIAYVNGQEVQVHLIRGAVDVMRRGAARSAETTRLNPGEGLLYDGGATPRLSPPQSEPADEWPTGMVEFRKAPLADVIAQMNRYAVTKVRLADPTLGTIEVSGVFRIDDPEALSVNLAQLLGLEIERASGEIILTRRTK